MVKMLTELEYLRKVQIGIIASEKLAGNIVKEECAKGTATGLLMAQNVIRKIAQENIEDSKNSSAPPVQQTKVQICPHFDEWTFFDSNGNLKMKVPACANKGKL